MYLDRSKVLCCSFLLVALLATCIGLIIYVAIVNNRSSGNNGGSENNGDVPVTTEDTRREQWEFNLRLPNDALPINYSVYLHPDLETAGFSGNSSVLVNVADGYNRSNIWLHSRYLNITSVKVFRVDDGKIDSNLDATFSFYEKHDFLLVQLEKIIEPGNYSINFEFKGNLTSDPVDGFYRSSYVFGLPNSKFEKRYLATTQMEATYAREAFPCFDEPGFKANFSVTIVRPENYTALSNMPFLTDVVGPSPGFHEVKFQTTVRMATYAVAFIVCDFPSLKSETKSGIPFQTFAPPAEINSTSYALSIGTKILDFYEELFEIPYPLPKQDMIVIPDFDMGAMENWGLITFRETALPYDENKSSVFDKQNTATTVAHELSHMWFGNLVTMKWWDDIWLNEGFATYISYKGTGHVEPTWDVDSIFLVFEMYRAMRVDFLNSSHPIVQHVSDPVYVTEMFDLISYKKGASILRMTENAIGSKQFRSGVNSYLSKYKFNNTQTQDLYDELQTVIDSGSDEEKFNLTRYMRTWTYQTGYPILTVTEGNDSYTIKQNLYYKSPEEKEYFESKNTTSLKWDIFITYKHFTNDASVNNSTLVNSTWLFINDTEQTIPKVPGKTLKLNIDQFGYFVTNYDNNTWKELSKLLTDDPEVFSPQDRSNLVENVFSLANSGILNYSYALNLSTYLKKEQHFVPWRVGSYAIAVISGSIWNQPFYQLWKKYALNLVEDIYRQVTWEDTGSHLEKMMRNDILNTACQLNHDDCMTQAAEKFLQWIKDNTTFIPPNIRMQVYNYGMIRVGTEKEWDIIFQRYREELVADEKLSLLNALAMTSEPWIIQRYIEYALNEEFVRYQDCITVLDYIASKHIGKAVLWDFVRNEWSRLLLKFKTQTIQLEKLVVTIVSSFNTHAKLKEVMNFYSETNQTGVASKYLRDRGIQSIKSNILWLERSGTEIQNWLHSQGYNME